MTPVARRSWWTAPTLAGCLFAAASAAAARQATETLAVRTFLGPRLFDARNPDESESLATRSGVNQNRDFTLTSRVVLSGDGPKAAQAGARWVVGAARPLDGAPGYWTLEAGSVRDAAALADSLARDGWTDAHVDLRRPITLRTPTDPQFWRQWHLKNDQDPLFDANLEPAWNAGYTGAGVVIGIVEGRWQHDHPDLAANFNAAASQSTTMSVSSHATSVAGVAAAVADNGTMGAGAAFGAQISNQFIGSDAENASALAFEYDLNDIKSNSWGPFDDANLSYMSPEERAAILNAIANGRSGRGEIFVWAAGNGGQSDRVDYDAYASSRYTIAVGAVGDQDLAASYNETGSSMMIVAPSSGNVRTIYTTAAGGGQTTNFGGTSSACPLAAGVVALTLEANPDLTWRDVQHVLIESARVCDPQDAAWTLNGAGRLVNYRYGHGALDAAAAVALAQDWRNVAHEVVVSSGRVPVNQTLPNDDTQGLTQTFFVDRNLRVETVELLVSAQTERVGDLRIVFNSPSGAESLLTKTRTDLQDDLSDYVFTSFRHWGESSAGEWVINLSDRLPGPEAVWLDYELRIYGAPLCRGDVDGDGAVGLEDLIRLLNGFGYCEGDDLFEPAADSDNNGCVDFGDLAEALSRFGASCE